MNKEMGYHPDPANPGFWFYDTLRIQADVDTHKFAVGFAKNNYPKGSKVLDIATGEGALAKQLLDNGFEVSCTSWNERARVAIPTYRINLDHSFSSKDVGDYRYPLVCAIEIIEHTENPSCFLRSCCNVLAPGGHLLLSTPNVESSAARLQWLVRGCPGIFDVEEVQNNRHITMLWSKGLEYMIERCGFSILERHLLGCLQPRRTALSTIKDAVYWLMERVFHGDTRGNSRLYVLTASMKKPLQNDHPDRYY